MNAKLGVSILVALLAGIQNVPHDRPYVHASTPHNATSIGTPGADQESKTLDDDGNQSGPGTTQPLLPAVMNVLESLGANDASSCMAALGVLLSTPYSKLKAVLGWSAKFCSAPQQVLMRVWNLTDRDCLARKPADPEIEIGSGNSLITTSETITSDGFNIMGTLELAREKLSRCCECQTATKTQVRRPRGVWCRNTSTTTSKCYATSWLTPMQRYSWIWHAGKSCPQWQASSLRQQKLPPHKLVYIHTYIYFIRIAR